MPSARCSAKATAAISPCTRRAIGRVGALCCWEHIQPLSKYAMYSMNEQVHVASWPSFSLYRGAAYALGPEVNNAASQIYAVEGQCFVLAPCATVSPEMLKMLIPSKDREMLLLEGGGFAMIYGPDGRPLAERLPETTEGLIYADIDLGMISLAKAAADPTGHYSRPDVTRLLLNTTPARPVEQARPSVQAGRQAPPAEAEGEAETEAADRLRQQQSDHAGDDHADAAGATEPHSTPRAMAAAKAALTAVLTKAAMTITVVAIVSGNRPAAHLAS